MIGTLGYYLITDAGGHFTNFISGCFGSMVYSAMLVTADMVWVDGHVKKGLPRSVSYTYLGLVIVNGQWSVVSSQ